MPGCTESPSIAVRHVDQQQPPVPSRHIAHAADGMPTSRAQSCASRNAHSSSSVVDDDHIALVSVKGPFRRYGRKQRRTRRCDGLVAGARRCNVCAPFSVSDACASRDGNIEHCARWRTHTSGNSWGRHKAPGPFSSAHLGARRYVSCRGQRRRSVDAHAAAVVHARYTWWRARLLSALVSRARGPPAHRGRCDDADAQLRARMVGRRPVRRRPQL